MKITQTASALVSHILPFAPAMRDYSWAKFRADIMAAITVAPIAIPQAMAYALIAGVHPKYGLYASILPVIITALWGSSRFSAAGPTNATSMVLASTLAQITIGGALLTALPVEARMPFIFALAILSGLMQLGMGLARLGDLANFISHSVMVGFTCGAALLIVAGQTKTMLGLRFTSDHGFFPTLIGVGTHIQETNLWSLGLTLGTVAIILGLRRLSRRLPSALGGLVLISVISWLGDAPARGVHMVAAIPQQMPPLSLPASLDWGMLRTMFMPALAIALLGAVESLAIGKNLAAAKRDAFDGNQELIGLGLGNVAAGFTSGIPGCASFGRSVLNVTSGGRTRFTTVYSGLMALPILLLLAPAANYIPMPALGGILLLIAKDMINKEDIHLCLVATRIDRAVFLATLGAALLLSLEQAVFVGVFLSLTLFLYKEAHPRVLRLKPDDALLAPYPWLEQCPHLVVYNIEGTLFFGAIHELERQLQEQESQTAKAVVLHLRGVFWIDASGAHALEQFVERCNAHSIPLFLVVNDTVRAILTRTGVLAPLGESFVTATLIDALHNARAILQKSQCRKCESKGTCLPQQTIVWPGSPAPTGEAHDGPPAS